MRLWHKDLIPLLPRQQLLSQWRECCCIARHIREDGTPNHILVNKVLNYPDEEFNTYADRVIVEMRRRGYAVRPDRFWQWRENTRIRDSDGLFEGWHNDRYLRQCLANLQEKYDCGGITDDEWIILANLSCHI